MNSKQPKLRRLYPLLMKLTRLFGVYNRVQHNTSQVKPVKSFYHLQATQNNGQQILMQQYQGKKVLIVNTASQCGYTMQYGQLQQLHLQYPQLVILGFPANDFKEQEQGNDNDIARFCEINFGVTFPLMKKSTVVKTGQQNEVFRWLSNRTENGWNNVAPEWNFSKYLINEQGQLQGYFGSSVSPLSNTLIKAIKE